MKNRVCQSVDGIAESENQHQRLIALNIELMEINQTLLVAKKNLLQQNEELVKDLDRHQSQEKKNADMLIHAGRLALLGEMATSVAHELNQPLSIIRTNMQSLQFMASEQFTPADIADILASCIRQTDRASNIINHIRTFARVNQTVNDPVDLVLPLDAALELFNEQFRLHEIIIHREYEKDIPPFCCSAQEMEQLVVNLLSNARYAVEAMKEKSPKDYKMQITLRLKHIRETKQILFELSDNGIGMSKEILERCFDPFFTTKPVGEGTGLGLSIIRGIIKNLNGTISIESELGQGATFRILFPYKN